MANNQEKSQELIIFYKKNNILYLFLRNLGFFATFAGKVQYKYTKHSIGIMTTCYTHTQVECGMTQSTVLGIPTTGLSSLLLLQHHQSFDELSGCHSWASYPTHNPRKTKHL